MWRQLSLPVLFSFFLLMVFAGIASADPGHGSVPLQEPQPQMAPAPPPQPPMAEPVETEPEADMGNNAIQSSTMEEMEMDQSKTEKRHTAKEKPMEPSKKTHAGDSGHGYYLNRPSKNGFAVAAVLSLLIVGLLAASLRLPHRLAPANPTHGIPIPKKHAWEV